MMRQDKLANPCQVILVKLAICFGLRFGLRKMERAEKVERSRSETAAAVPQTEARRLCGE